jgi:1,4-dihydroxy-2-naphthoyl-CoA hydrolase
MSIWFGPTALDDVNAHCRETLVRHLGIEIVEIGADYLKARMPVDERTHQPAGLLHGGASAALAETLASEASMMCLDRTKQRCVGLEVNANHVRGVQAGFVTGIARPIHLGRTTHVWDVRITDARDKLVCIARMTMAILNMPTVLKSGGV